MGLLWWSPVRIWEKVVELGGSIDSTWRASLEYWSIELEKGFSLQLAIGSKKKKFRNGIFCWRRETVERSMFYFDTGNDFLVSLRVFIQLVLFFIFKIWKILVRHWQPALSIGNVGQLATDLLISSLRAERIGYFDDPNVLPCVGNNAYSPSPPGDLVLPLEGNYLLCSL